MDVSEEIEHLENNKKNSKKSFKISENSARKAKNHLQRMIMTFYCFVVFGCAFSITLINTNKDTPENEISFAIFYVTIYITSIICIIFTLLYVYRNRHSSLEFVAKGHVNATKIVFSLHGEGINLYLRIGIGLFASMSIVYSIARCYEIAQENEMTPLFIIYTFFKVSFFVAQTIFALVLHRIVILVRVRLFAFILLHILTVNLCVWANAAVKKISKNLGHMHNPHNENETEANYHELPITMYFLPAVPEYCAISIAMAYELLHRIGKLKQIETHHSKPIQSIFKSMNPGLIGIIIGSVISLCVLAIILCLEILNKKLNNNNLIIHLIECIILFVVGCIFFTLGLINTRNLKFAVNFANQNMDGKLLMVTFFLTVIYLVACIVMTLVYLIYVKLSPFLYDCMIVQLVKVLLELIQVMGQTYFIMDAFYRCCHDQKFEKQKPGQSMIALLSAINFSLWMIYSFQVKHNDILFSLSSDYGDNVYLQKMYIFINVILPMVMLFRYHSSVCLAIEFVRVYEDEISRYESMLRGVPHAMPLPFFNQINDKNVNHAVALTSTIGKTRVRAISAPNLKPFNQLKDIFLCANTIDDNHNASNDSIESTSDKSDEPVYNKNQRRTTHISMELAQYRIQASEFEHRMTELKLKKNKNQGHSSNCKTDLRNILRFKKDFANTIDPSQIRRDTLHTDVIEEVDCEDDDQMEEKRDV